MMRIVPGGTEPLGQLSPQPWMDAPETKAVVAALTADGAEVRFVGGCVRDSVLKRAIKDVDIATHDPPARVLALLDEAGIHAIPTGIAHGTVTAVIGKSHFEITTLREDVQTYGRHATVAFTDDWTADAARRDFTMNAMCADPQGRVYDPFNGLADLGAGWVRFVGNPMKRIEEDVLRLLRFFRFFAHYGRPPMDPAAVEACRKSAPLLVNLSGERVAGELIRLLQAPDPASVLIVMHAEGILAPILPEACEFGRLKVSAWLESRAMVRASVLPDAIRRLGAMVNTDANGAKAIGERLKLSAVQTKRLTAIVVPQVDITVAMDERAARRALHKIGADTFRDLVLVAWAGQRSVEGGARPSETVRWMRLLDLADQWQPVALPIRGADALALGIPRGREIGRVLGLVETWWEDNDFRPTRDQALEKLRAVIAAG